MSLVSLFSWVIERWPKVYVSGVREWEYDIIWHYSKYFASNPIASPFCGMHKGIQCNLRKGPSMDPQKPREYCIERPQNYCEANPFGIDMIWWPVQGPCFTVVAPIFLKLGAKVCVLWSRGDVAWVVEEKLTYLVACTLFNRIEMCNFDGLLQVLIIEWMLYNTANCIISILVMGSPGQEGEQCVCNYRFSCAPGEHSLHL